MKASHSRHLKARTEKRKVRLLLVSGCTYPDAHAPQLLQTPKKSIIWTKLGTTSWMAKAIRIRRGKRNQKTWMSLSQTKAQ